jgi:endo-1,3-1,4-beta-glycanase ExoK
MFKYAAFALAALTHEATANYYSGEVKTWETFQYGKFRTAMKTGNHYGTVASFFTYWNGPNWSVGQWNEIDVEIVPSVQAQGKQPFSTNIIYGDGHNGKREEQSYKDFGHDWTKYHIYEIEWTPDYIRWTIDGKEVRKSWAGDSAGVRFTNKQQHIMMNFWTPTWDSWGHGRNDYDMPWYVYYDWVEIYSYDHSSKNFHLKWRDDFNGNNLAGVDGSKWQVSDNWTFESNASTFVKNHVYIWDGAMCLKMAKSHYAEHDESLTEETFD